MGQDGHPTRGQDQAYGLLGRKPRPLYVRRPPTAKMVFKGFPYLGNIPAFNHGLSDMGAPDQAAPSDFEQPLP